MPPYPVAESDYPGNWLSFQEWFSSEYACARYLTKLRWRDGFVCPLCGSTEGWATHDKLSMRCKKCGRRISVTANTAFEATKKGLLTWFAAAWYVTNQKNGVSALGLQRVLGFQSEQTAWAWLRKLRRAMMRPGRDKLRGRIEVDETLVGGAEKGVRGRQTQTKSLVLILAERKADRMGRIRLVHIKDASAVELKKAIEATVEDGAIVYTDDWAGYTDTPDPNNPDKVLAIDPKKYRHVPVNLSKSGKKAHDFLPKVHRVATLLKRWWLGTHQGSIRPGHLQHYLDEFTFRFNRRTSGQRGMLFYRLIEQAVMVDHTPYKQLLDPKRKKMTRKVMPSFKNRTQAQLLTG